MNVKLKYVCSNGATFDLMGKMYRVRSGNFHTRSWSVESEEKQFGEKVNRFKKSAITYNFVSNIRGSMEERKKYIDSLHDAFEYDITHKTPGTIWWNNWYINCYMIASETLPSQDSVFWTDDRFDIYCPYPFWIEEQKVSIYANSLEESSGNTKKYPFTYAYSYGSGSGNKVIDIDHNTDCDFRLVAYGPLNPLNVTISGNVYKVDYQVDEGEYIVIDTRDSQPAEEVAYVVNMNGEKVNVFDYRDPEYSLRKKIPAKAAEIRYSGTYGIDLTIFKERSEPRWN